MSKKATIEEFISKARAIHGNKYDYSCTDYINNKTKILIHCSICGHDFEQTPDNHINGKYGCPYCSNKKKHTTDEFKDMAVKIHGDRYDYTNSKYVNNHTKILIHCNSCGHDFEQTPTNHLHGKQGCPYCSGNMALTMNSFIEKAEGIHGNIYDYSNVDYLGYESKVKIVCKKCGKVFLQTPHHHLAGQGCPNCSKSHGETRVASFLEENNIRFEREKRYSDCKDIKPLPFDFYLPDYNLLIEYQGEQHFKPRGKFGNPDKVRKQQYHDSIKREYCLMAKNPSLLEISYKEYDHIDDILTKTLNLENIKP